MSEPFIGEIRLFAGNFAPLGWSLCNGQLIAISENDALFNLIGTTYGGDGQSTFALPDLRGRLPMHQGGGFVIGQTGGVEEVTLTVQQMAAHTHAFLGSTNTASSTSPTNQVPALTQAATITAYGTDAPLLALLPSSVSSVGNNLPHTNFQPYLCVNFIISQYGIYPPPA